MKTERGVILMHKNGKAWGIEYEDGQCTSYGWVDVDEAVIYDPLYCKKPSDIVYKGSPDTAMVNEGFLMLIERTTEVRFITKV